MALVIVFGLACVPSNGFFYWRIGNYSMTIRFNQASTSNGAQSNLETSVGSTKCAELPKKKSTHTKPRPIDQIAFDQPGMLRVGHLMTVFSLSHSGLYQRLKLGQIPPPDGYYESRTCPETDNKKRKRTPYWLTSTIRPLLGSI